MNNLLVAILVFTAAALAWWHQLTRTQAARSEAVAMAARIEPLEQALAAEQAALSSLEAEIKARQESARTAQAALEQASADARMVLAPEDFSTDGPWPSSRDYFYLPKQFLGSLGYEFFHKDGRLTDQAAALFGLTPAEKTDLTAWFRDLRMEYEQLQLQAAERLKSTQADSENYREISFRLPALTNEVESLRHRVQQDLRKRIGESRGELIWQKISQEEPLNGYPLGDEERTITYSASRNSDGTVLHKLTFQRPNSSYTFPIQFEPEPHQGMIHEEDDGSRSAVLGVKLPLSPESALWNWRHLFGDQPLLQ